MKAKHPHIICSPVASVVFCNIQTIEKMNEENPLNVVLVSYESTLSNDYAVVKQDFAVTGFSFL